MANNIKENKEAKMPLKDVQDQRNLMDMVMGFQKSQIIYTATQLGIFEELYHKQKPTSAKCIADTLNLDPSATERLLNSCVPLGLAISSLDDDKRCVYQCSNLTKSFLLKSSKMSFKPLVQNVGDMYHLYGKMPDIIKEGQAVNNNVDLFDCENGHYGKDPTKLAFMKAMHMFAMKDAQHILVAMDFSKYKTICDLGGCTGALGSEIAKRNPTSEVISYDLPHVTQVAQHFHDKIPHNLQFESGDFFSDHIPQADMYILSNVIHDWSEEKIGFLIQTIHSMLQPGGCLLILEKVLTETKSGPTPAVFMDMNMLVGSEGKERNAIEYKALLKKHGFAKVNVTPLQYTMYRDVILSFKL